MKNVDIEHCTIFEIPLFENLGNLYGKILYSGEFLEHNSKKLLLRVFDYHSFTSFSDEDYSIIETKGLFIYPLLLTSLPKIRGDIGWNILGKSNFREEDKEIPAYLKHNPVLGRKLDNKSMVSVILDLNVSNRIRLSYTNVSHLPPYMLYDSTFITMLLTIEYLRKEGKTLKEKPSVNGFSEFDFKYCKKLVEKLPKYWEIPNNIKGKIQNDGTTPN